MFTQHTVQRRACITAAGLVFALALAASPAFAQGNGEGGSDPLDPNKPAAEDTSVYQETPVIQGREASFSIAAFWSCAYSFLSSGTLDFEGEIDTDSDGLDDTEMDFQADGEWELAYLRGGVRMEIGRKTVKFRMDVFYQSILARFESDGKTSVEYYSSGPGSWTVNDSTVRNPFHLQGGGISLGFDMFFAVLEAGKGLDGVPRIALGPTAGLCIHLSGGVDGDEKFYAGFAGIDVGAGFKARFLNLLEVFAEIGLYGGATIGFSEEVNLAVAPGLCWRCCLGFGFCF